MLTGIDVVTGMGLIGFMLPLPLQDCELGNRSFLTLQTGVRAASDLIFAGFESRLACSNSKSAFPWCTGELSPFMRNWKKMKTFLPFLRLTPKVHESS